MEQNQSIENIQEMIFSLCLRFKMSFNIIRSRKCTRIIAEL